VDTKTAAYLEGFIKRCAELNLDPEPMLETLGVDVAGLKQAADPVQEGLATGLSPLRLWLGAVPGVGRLQAIGEGAGGLTGLLQEGPDAEEKQRLADRPAALSLLPGVGTYNMARRAKGVADQSAELGGEHPYANMWTEELAPISQILAGLGGGAAVGGAVRGREGVLPGMAIGAGAASLPVLIGAIAAGIRKRRTEQEQADTETGGRVALKALVPGVGTYDRFKRLGVSRNWEGAPKQAAGGGLGAAVARQHMDTKTAAYLEGFIKRCAELNLDPEPMLEKLGVDPNAPPRQITRPSLPPVRASALPAVGAGDNALPLPLNTAQQRFNSPQPYVLPPTPQPPLRRGFVGPRSGGPGQSARGLAADSVSPFGVFAVGTDASGKVTSRRGAVTDTFEGERAAARTGIPTISPEQAARSRQ
jgi:hypothetical protein